MSHLISQLFVRSNLPRCYGSVARKNASSRGRVLKLTKLIEDAVHRALMMQFGKSLLCWFPTLGNVKQQLNLNLI